MKRSILFFISWISRVPVGGRTGSALFQYPFSVAGPILETQRILSLILEQEDEWPLTISNGTVMVMERFYETAIDEIPGR